ncbi:hypothetical protein MTR67_001177 [Solanum verrucosum]|uniref:Uncharacterized protein n=1 Tax=Solanum verrucosum TaxID=315347 RepID=A0AAF0T4U6_SOLVR|nr:hypothetical protein MTR67_001177 [Solanum verrucosum]
MVPLESVAVKDSLTYEEVPVEILDRQVRRLRNKEVTSVKSQYLVPPVVLTFRYIWPHSITLIVVHTHPEVVDHEALHEPWIPIRAMRRLVDARQSYQGSGIQTTEPSTGCGLDDGSSMGLSSKTTRPPAQGKNHSAHHDPWSFTRSMKWTVVGSTRD